MASAATAENRAMIDSANSGEGNGIMTVIAVRYDRDMRC